METAVYLNGEFINLYTKDNPILEEGQQCYGLIFNNDDYHRPLVIKGVIISDKFCDGLNKQYFVRVLEIIESPKVIQDFFIGKSITIYPYYNETLHSKKIIKVTNNFEFNWNLFKLESFFVRNSEEKIIELRNEYISIVRKDIIKMLSDIDSI